jgi:hypothetical protein
MSSSDASSSDASSSASFSLDTCGDSCGWIAAILAALCYGSFGVPIKWTKQLHLGVVNNNNQTTSGSDGSDGSDGCCSDDPGVVVVAVVNDDNDNDLHPLVLQSYKTFTMFLLSWLVLFLPNVSNWRVDYTHWGLLSGMLWVLGGTGGVVSKVVRRVFAFRHVSNDSTIVHFAQSSHHITFFSSSCLSFFCLLGLGMYV